METRVYKLVVDNFYRQTSFRRSGLSTILSFQPTFKSILTKGFFFLILSYKSMLKEIYFSSILKAYINDYINLIEYVLYV